MACRLITEKASDAEIASLRKIFTSFENGQVQAHIDEYSDRNIQFHQKILELSGCSLLKETADRLFLHMKGIRARTISELDRAKRSIIDHMHIIDALEARNTEPAERQALEPTLNLTAPTEATVPHQPSVRGGSRSHSGDPGRE